MPKPDISDVEYETQIDHLTRSEAMIAVDAAKTMGDVRAIFYGESWGNLKRFWEEGMQQIERPVDIFAHLYPIWRNLFSHDIPSFVSDNEGGIAWNVVSNVVKQIAKRILDEVYDVVEIM